MVFCSKCGAEREGFLDPSVGNISCEVCGIILEESTIVSEITFSEDSHVVGQHVSESGSSFNQFRTLSGSQTNSREITLDKMKKRLAMLASQLNISTTLTDKAHRFFKLALQNNFTRGRKRNHVAASCLYLACRLEKTSHMLLDFSEQLQEDVFLLGYCFSSLIKTLKIEYGDREGQLPLVEPWYYIHRFAAQLEFGSKTNAVINTALKLVQRMKRDWMQIGRRPAGLCASALIIAARIHGFRRSQEEVANKVRICSATISKRLQEFAQTPASQMTPEEFERNGETIELEMDPPSFSKKFKKKKKGQDEENSEEEDEEKEKKNDPELEDLSEKINLDKDEAVMKEMEDTMSSKTIQSLVKDVEYTAPELQPEEKLIFDHEEIVNTRILPDDDGKLEELDDDEIDEYLLTDENEIKSREIIFDFEYKEVLEEKERKQKEKDDKPPKKKRKKKLEEEEIIASSAAEATANMLKQRHSRAIPGIDVNSLFSGKTKKMEEEQSQIQNTKMEQILENDDSRKRKVSSPTTIDSNQLLKEFSF